MEEKLGLQVKQSFPNRGLNYIVVLCSFRGCFLDQGGDMSSPQDAVRLQLPSSLKRGDPGFWAPMLWAGACTYRGRFLATTCRVEACGKRSSHPWMEGSTSVQELCDGFAAGEQLPTTADLEVHPLTWSAFTFPGRFSCEQVWLVTSGKESETKTLSCDKALLPMHPLDLERRRRDKGRWSGFSKILPV